MTKTRATKPSTAELRDGNGPWTPCDVTLLPEPNREAGDPRPVFELWPKSGDEGCAVRFTIDEAADIVSALTAFILKHGRTA